MTTNNNGQENKQYSFDLQKFLELKPINYGAYDRGKAVLDNFEANDFSYNLDEGNFVYKKLKNIVDKINRKNKLEKAISFFNEENSKKLDGAKKVINNTSDLSLQYLDFFKDAYLDCKEKINETENKILEVQREHNKVYSGEGMQKDTPLSVLCGVPGTGTQLARERYANKKYEKDLKKNNKIKGILKNRKKMLQEKYSEMIDLFIESESKEDKIDISKELFTSYILKNKSRF